MSFRVNSISENATGRSGADFIEIAPEIATESNWVTVILGRNGVGKSTLLQRIALTFAVDTRIPSYGRRHYEESRSALSSWVTRCSTESGSFPIQADLNIVRRHVVTNLGEHPGAGPATVIAVSRTSHDKFPLSPSMRSLDRGFSSVDQNYTYLGMRSALGGNSMTNWIHNVVDSVVIAADRQFDRNSKIASVLSTHGYRPVLSSRYRISPHSRYALKPNSKYSRIDHSNWREAIWEFANENSDELPSLEIIEILNDSDVGHRVDAFFGLSGEVIDRKYHGVFDLFLGTQDGSAAGFYRILQVLKRMRVVTLESAGLYDVVTGGYIPFQSMSSGEFSLVTTLIGIAATIKDNSLVLIDEPELSLHPEWQEAFIPELVNLFRDVRGCHFLVATHSPLIVSKVDGIWGNIVHLDSLQSERECFLRPERSVDEILVEDFGVATDNNLYVKQCVSRALTLLSRVDPDLEELDSIQRKLKSVLNSLTSGSPLRILAEEVISIGDGRHE